MMMLIFVVLDLTRFQDVNHLGMVGQLVVVRPF